MSEDHFLIMFRLRFENWSTQGLPVASSLEIMKHRRHSSSFLEQASLDSPDASTYERVVAPKGDIDWAERCIALGGTFGSFNQ